MRLPVLLDLLAGAGVLGLAGGRVGIPVASLLAGLVRSVVAHAAGAVHGATAPWVIFTAFAITGAVLGTRTSRVSLVQIRGCSASCGRRPRASRRIDERRLLI